MYSTTELDLGKTYGLPESYEICYSVESSYDQGFILGNIIGAPSPVSYFTWILKIDRNGDILWSKYLYNQSYLFQTLSVATSENGDILLTGATEQFDNWGDVFIMKLNACGEKVWCKVISFNDMNYGYRIKNLENGNHAVYTRYAATSFMKANQLWILDTNGNIVSSFQIIPPNSHPNIWDPLVEDFIITNDGGYLFTGDCYFPDDTINPQWWYLQHLITKFDSLGNEQWVRPQVLDTTNHVGTITRSVERNEKYYIVGDKSLLYSSSFFPYNGIIGDSGNLIFEKELHPDTLLTLLYGIDVMNDGTLIQTGKISYTGNLPINTGVFKTDTLFNIIASLQCDSGTVTGECIAKSIDNKFLLTGYSPTNTSTWYEFDAFAMKVNENLEYDTLYTFPFVYDSLCPFPIPTDTIDCDCDLITGYGEPVKVEERYKMHIYPNPADERVQIRLNDVTGATDMQGKKLVMYDLFGRRILERDFVKEAGLNISEINPGIYILVVEQKGVILAREKLIVL